MANFWNEIGNQSFTTSPVKKFYQRLKNQNDQVHILFQVLKVIEPFIDKEDFLFFKNKLQSCEPTS